MTGRPAYLWIVRDKPFPPNHGGDCIYSSQMIAALANTGAEVVVLTHGGGGPVPADFPRSVSLHETRGPPPPAHPLMLLSPLPSIAARHAGSKMRDLLDWALASRRWDAVIIDHIGSGWAADTVRRSGACMVYLSHNHETSVRSRVAQLAMDSPLKKAAMLVDAAKFAPLERKLVTLADLVCAITEADKDLFRRAAPDKRYVVLPPGYDGTTTPPRDLASIPRNAVILGSFDWVAKQANLSRFLAVAADAFAAAEAGLTVVGAIPDAFRAMLAERYPKVTVTGAVDDVAPWLSGARLGIIPEATGGGFKLKALSYVFGRVPIAAIDGSYSGLPVTPDKSILSFPDLSSLAVGALAALDDIDGLTRLETAALAACQGRFNWADRGPALVQAIKEARG